MATASRTVSKIYPGFLLDKPKLTRIVNIIQNRLSPATFSFQVTLKNEKVLKMSTLDDVFSVDNAIKNPIVLLKILVSDEPKQKDCLVAFNNDTKVQIFLQVKSNTSRDADEIFAELDEQIERTLLTGWIYRIRKSDSFLLFLATAGLLAAIFGLLTALDSEKRGNSLSREDLQYLAEKSGQADSLEKKVDFLFESQRKLLVKETMATSPTAVVSLQVFTRRNVFIGAPLIFVVGLVVYALIFLYPSAGFLWGDYGERHQQIVGRRKNIWIVVVVALLINLVAGIFLIGLADFLRVGS